MFLLDVDSSGRVIDWKRKKLNNLEIASSYRRLGNVKKFSALHQCSDVLIYKVFPDNTKKLHKANFCRQRLCNLCNWRKALKLYSQVSSIMDWIDANKKGLNYVFLTLTIKNCDADNLNNHINILLRGYDKLFKRRPLQFILGSFRSLEVTFNKNNKTFHPHLHCILIMPKDYYSRKYISQKKWSQYWQECIKSDYTPIVHVEKISGNIKKGICEATKYAVKENDLIYENKDIQDFVIDTLDCALSGRRLTSFRGLFYEVRKILKCEDVEIGDLVVTSGDDIRDDLSYILSVYRWSFGIGNYLHVENIKDDKLKEYLK